MTERDYIRLTTLGKLYLGQRVLSELMSSLRLAGLDEEAASMQEAYAAGEQAMGKLRDPA